ncbi:hypothetical protein H920_04082 [Fukomys damarensis]|uniref:Uncharacterized protein n=1 Tax=Fukomys damarensis TaxID=885580 RepID=A0A091DVJ2_FUKDA|nr:hypothetical protein H920_04082 [Fukomys damarensis]
MPACVILTNQAPPLRRREPPSPADSHPEFMQGMKNPEIMVRDISPFLKITRAQEEPVNHPGRKVVEAGKRAGRGEEEEMKRKERERMEEKSKEKDKSGVFSAHPVAQVFLIGAAAGALEEDAGKDEQGLRNRALMYAICSSQDV